MGYWKPIAGASGYLVGRGGEITRWATDSALLTPQPDHQGYLRVRIAVDGQRRWLRVHVLVLTAFRGPRPSLRHEGAHVDGQKANCALSNLAWKTPEDNARDRKRHGTLYRGGRGRVVTEEEQEEITARVLGGESRTKIAKQFGIHRSTVTEYLRRRGVKKASPREADDQLRLFA